MGADAADLDRFDSDSEDAPVPAAAPPSAGASPSSPADGKGGGTSKAARLRAKKAAARAAQKARRREAKARFPPKPESTSAIDERDAGSDGEEENDGDASSDEDASSDDGDGDGKEKKKKRRNDVSHDASDKTHHGVLNVEGVLVDGKLVLVDRKTTHVYSSTRRAHDGTHLRVGTWDAENATVRRLPRRDVNAQLAPPPRKKKKESLSEEPESPDDEINIDGSLRMELPPVSVTHAFEVDPDDHCETSPEAHKNVVNFLAKIAEKVGKKPSDLIIYDPFYCAGGTKRSFKTLGFPNVINENVDFYDVIKNDAVPEHDVLVTNPPYSADHVEKCLQFAAENLEKHSRPYFLLLPSYVVNKPYYVDALLTGGARGRAWRERNEKEKDASSSEDELLETETRSLDKSASDEPLDGSQSDSEEAMKVHDASARGKIRDGKIRDVKASTNSSRKQTLPFYVAPTKRYYYWTPKALAQSRRRAKSDSDASALIDAKKRKRGHVGRLGERTSPFPSFWYCGLGEGFQTDVLRWHRKLPRAMVDGYAVAAHPNDLPLHVLDEWDPRRDKLMEKARKDGESGGWRNGGKDGKARKPPPRRFAGFSGANCGQNMPAKDKKKYAEFSTKKDDNWGNGKGTLNREGAMFTRPRRKNKY